MKLFAIGDPHLSLGIAGKSMERFGDAWTDHVIRFAEGWRSVVADEDIVAVPGDISWAMRMPEVQPDLAYLDDLPGRKVLCRGNHDYWWSGMNKVRAALPPSLSAVGGDAFLLDGVVFAGTRLWDVPGIGFRDVIDWRDESGSSISAPPRERSDDDRAKDEKVYRRELLRLERALASLSDLRQRHEARLAMLLIHYPPTDVGLSDTEVTELIERYPVDHVVFGHLHSLRGDLDKPFGTRGTTSYHLTSCDYLNMTPTLIASLT